MMLAMGVTLMLSTYDQMLFLTSTVAMEAAGEPYDGKLAVAFVIVNRVKANKSSITDEVLKKLQFSAWNTGSTTRGWLDNVPDDVWRDCWKAATAAYFGHVDDLTSGATFYLNEELTREIRGDGTLPSWVAQLTKTATVGKHTFYKQEG
jgi:spore germination cell wall hydrolase CwlJ-like protein